MLVYPLERTRPFRCAVHFGVLLKLSGRLFKRRSAHGWPFLRGVRCAVCGVRCAVRSAYFYADMLTCTLGFIAASLPRRFAKRKAGFELVHHYSRQFSKLKKNSEINVAKANQAADIVAIQSNETKLVASANCPPVQLPNCSPAAAEGASQGR